MTFDPYDFSNSYNTPLSPEQEAAFQLWKYAKDVRDYDMRGAWLEMQLGLLDRGENAHFPDRYKKPNHPTFSNESIYHGADGYYGGTWQQLLDGRYIYNVNVTNTWSPDRLTGYFNIAEPQSVLADTGVRW